MGIEKLWPDIERKNGVRDEGRLSDIHRYWQQSCFMQCVNVCETKTILYVEDDAVTMTAYRNRLQAEGFYVQTARDGLEAMKILARSVPDLVIVDLNLPRFNGEEVLKFMQANASLRSLPFVILSNHSIRDAAAEPLLKKASRRFLKGTCDTQTFLDAVRGLLSDFRMRKIVPIHTPNNFFMATSGQLATA